MTPGSIAKLTQKSIPVQKYYPSSSRTHKATQAQPFDSHFSSVFNTERILASTPVYSGAAAEPPENLRCVAGRDTDKRRRAGLTEFDAIRAAFIVEVISFILNASLTCAVFIDLVGIRYSPVRT